MTLQERPDLPLARILFRTALFFARQLAHEYNFRFTFNIPKDKHLFVIREDGEKVIAP